jgi:DNA-binding NarL/FixJ family response regulator
MICQHVVEIMGARAIIIEDDDATRKALCAALSSDPDFIVAASTGQYDEGIDLILKEDYAVLLIDLDIHGRSGIDLIHKCRQHKQAKIIVVSVLGDETTVISAIEAGADGYILKDSAYADLPSLVKKVLNDEAPISPAVARHLLRRFQYNLPGDAEAKDAFTLSRRERQVLRELARGASNKEVALKFDLSVHTIGDYVKSLYKKLSVSSRGEAVNKAVKHGIIKL